MYIKEQWHQILCVCVRIMLKIHIIFLIINYNYFKCFKYTQSRSKSALWRKKELNLIILMVWKIVYTKWVVVVTLLISMAQ